MIRMNSTNLLLYKNDANCVILNEQLISTIMECFNMSNIKTYKNTKKQVNILKNNKIQIKKDLNENKIIMIMNKLSHNNLNELIKEYLSIITVLDYEQYNIIQNEILIKMVKDINFIDNYIPFIIILFGIEKHRLNLNPDYFIIKLEEILKSSNELDRHACLEIIKRLIKLKFFKDSMYDYISTLLNNDNIPKVDIYNWFNNNYRSKYRSVLLDNIKYCIDNNMTREQYMIESLLSNQVDSPDMLQVDSPVTPDKPDSHDSPDTQSVTLINNIIEEYLYIENIDEIINFLNIECKDLSGKNIFCKELLKFYIDTNKNSILNLLETLVKKKILFKSNLSKGLLLFIDNNNYNNNNYNNNNMEKFLKFLKNNNITKNIEHIFKKHKIKINYE